MSEAGGRERRRLRRVFHRVSARFESAGLRGQGHIKNLHKEGLFLRTNLLPQPGADVRVSFETRQGGKIEVQGIVRWTTDQVPGVDRAHAGFGMLVPHPSRDYLDFFESVLLH